MRDILMLAHRGWWTARAEQNTMVAFRRALVAGHGIETDVRDFAGRLVIAHDPPRSDALPFEAFLDLAAQYPTLPLAINIKSDGLAQAVTAAMREANHMDWFAFDMSVPDSLAWRRVGAPFLTRRSEYEEPGRLDAEAAGIWLDCFEADWWKDELVEDLLANGKIVAVVSPELHGRDPRPIWQRLRALRDDGRGRLMLCTDHPEQGDWGV
jgi:hypothetical protein